MIYLLLENDVCMNTYIPPCLTEIEEAPDDNVLRQVCITAADTTMEAGYTKPVATITMARKQELVRILMLQYILLGNKALLDQLKADLSTLVVLDAMAKYPTLIEPLFISGQHPPLTAGIACWAKVHRQH